MVVHFPEVIDGEVVLVITVVFLEDGCDFFLGLVAEGLGVHGLHELDETDTTCFFSVEFGDDFIGGLAVRVEAILGEEKLNIVREEYTHSGGVISVEDFLEVDDILVGERACDVEFRLELSEIFAFEADSILAGAVNARFGLIGAESELLGGVSELTPFGSLKGRRLIPGDTHRHR